MNFYSTIQTIFLEVERGFNHTSTMFPKCNLLFFSVPRIIIFVVPGVSVVVTGIM